MLGTGARRQAATRWGQSGPLLEVGDMVGETAGVQELGHQRVGMLGAPARRNALGFGEFSFTQHQGSWYILSGCMG